MCSLSVGRRPGGSACLVVPFLTWCLALGACDVGRGELPDEVEVTEVIVSSSDGFFRESCTIAVYRLEPAMADMVIEQGLAFFEGIESPRQENRYSEWMETPLPDPSVEPIYALGARGGCDGTGSDSGTERIMDALHAPGSFYAVTGNREGIIVVAPRARLAAFFYVG